MALKNDLSIRNAQHAVRAAEKAIGQARAAFLPQIQATTGERLIAQGPTSDEAYFDPQNQRWIQPGEQKFTTVSAGISLSQSIYNGGRNWAQMGQTKANMEMARVDLLTQRRAVVMIVKERYIEILRAEKLLEVAQEALRLSEAQLKQSQTMYELGSKSKLDMLKSRVKVASDKLNLISVQNRLDQARASLCRALVLDPSTPVQIVEEHFPLPDTLPNFEDALSRALRQRPEMGRAARNVKSKRAALHFQKGGHRPELYLSAGYSWSDEDYGKIWDMFSQKYSWSYGFSLSIPLFDGLATRSAVQSAQEMLRSAENSLEQQRQDITLELQQALLDLPKERERIELSQEGIASAEEDLRYAEESYRLGAGTILEVLDAQVKLTDARNARTGALYDYQLARLRLDKAMGKPLEGKEQ
jgi:outer membrane protein